MRKIFLGFAVTAAVMLTGCVQVPLSYQPTLQNLEALRTSGMAPANVGTFTLAPGQPEAMDQSVSARAATIVPPQKSFALFLKDALKQELQAAGKFDPNSTIVISGALTKNTLEAPIGTGKGTLAAKFSVDRDNKRVYEKELEEDAEWPSAFIGAEAIPVAITQYATLYKNLLGRLFSDEDFQKVTKAR